MKRYTKIFGTLLYCALMVGAILKLIVTVFYGINFTDSFYYLNIFSDISHPNAMLAGTQWIGNALMSLTGGELWAFRMCSVVLHLASVLIPFFVLLSKEERKEGFKWLCLAVLCIPNWHIMGPDPITCLLFSILVCLAIKYYDLCTRECACGGQCVVRWVLLFVMAVLSVFSGFCRLPNFSAIGAVCLIVALTEFQKPAGAGVAAGDSGVCWKFDRRSVWAAIGKCAGYLLCCAAFYFLFAYAFRCNPVVDGLKAIVTENGAGSDHSLHYLLTLDVHDVCFYALTALVLLGIAFSISKLETLQNGARKWLLYAGLLLTIFLVSKYYAFDYPNSIALQNTLIVACLFVMVLACRKDPRMLVPVSAIILFSVCHKLGSATGLLRFHDIMIPFIPYLMLKSKIKVTPLYQGVLFILAIALFWSGILAYEDKRPYKIRCEMSIDGINHIHTSAKRRDMIKDVIETYNIDRQQNDNILLFGWHSHMFRYLLDNHTYDRSFDFRMCENDFHTAVEMAHFVVRENYPVIYALESYPENYGTVPKVLGSKVDVELLEVGYTRVDHKYFSVYYPTFCCTDSDSGADSNSDSDSDSDSDRPYHW